MFRKLLDMEGSNLLFVPWKYYIISLQIVTGTQYVLHNLYKIKPYQEENIPATPTCITRWPFTFHPHHTESRLRRPGADASPSASDMRIVARTYTHDTSRAKGRECKMRRVNRHRWFRLHVQFRIVNELWNGLINGATQLQYNQWRDERRHVTKHSVGPFVKGEQCCRRLLGLIKRTCIAKTWKPLLYKSSNGVNCIGTCDWKCCGPTDKDDICVQRVPHSSVQSLAIRLGNSWQFSRN